MEPETKNKTVV